MVKRKHTHQGLIDMALTITQNGRTNVSGNRLTVSLSAVEGTASWPSGGTVFDATSYVKNPDMVHIENTGGFVFEYDRANKKIKAYVQHDPAEETGGANKPLQEATALNLTSLTLRVMITGGRA